MKHKNLILTALFSASLAIASIVSAQTPALTPEQKIEKRLAHVKQRLGLTDAQADQLKAIFEQNQQQLIADRQALKNAVPGNGAKKDAAKQLQSDRKAMMEKMGAVLTPEQREKFKQMLVERIDRKQERLERRKEMIMKQK